MSGQTTVTPGFNFPDGWTLTEAILRLIANPTVQVGENSIGAREINAADLLAAVGNTVRPNLFVNGNFTEERWLGATVAAPAGTDTVLAEGWWTNPTGAAITYGQTAASPDVNSVLCALLTGGVGATAVDFGQNLPRSAAALLWPKLTFSAWVYNNTGADFVPKLVLSTANALNDFSAVSEQHSEDLATCHNEAWTLVSATVDPGAYANRAAGMRVALRFAAGTLDAGGKTLSIARVKLEIGEAATAMPWDNGPDTALIQAVMKPFFAATVQVGCGMDYWGEDCPTGWIWAAGQALDRTTYAGLFAKFGTRYGAGDGVTTFNVPDKRERVSAGLGTMNATASPARLTAGISGVDGTTIGAAGGDERMQQHAHGSAADTIVHNYVAGGVAGASTGPTPGDTSVPTSAAGAGASQNVQPTIVCPYIIFAGV